MTVEHLLATITSRELTEWRLVYQLRSEEAAEARQRAKNG